MLGSIWVAETANLINKLTGIIAGADVVWRAVDECICRGLQELYVGFAKLNG
jgi:hypothetical protein